MLRSIILAIFYFSVNYTSAQTTQDLRGTVLDDASNVPIPGAVISILSAEQTHRALSDSLGIFFIQDLPVGRYDLQVKYSGYETAVIREILISSSKQPYLSIKLKETIHQLDEVAIKPRVNKEQPINTMATVSARQLSVEEAKRYAGGFDDPARLASSFAGVASNSSDNGIIVRGNAPKSLQWKMEGIEISNPNHFGDLRSFGGGLFTALSSQMLANSDFFTGAFPAEYNNAISGVFDINMRNGNNQKYEHTFQAGIVGLDASSEGPFKKGGKASYLFNYRYSTLALLKPLLPENASSISFQDLSFKLNFPTKKAGIFSLWGIGLIDEASAKAKTDSLLWRYNEDKENNNVKQFMGAVGLGHKFFLKNNSYLKTTLAATGNGGDWKTDRLNSQLALKPQSTLSNRNYTVVVSSFINHKFSARHTNKTGILYTGMFYDLNFTKSLAENLTPIDIVNKSGYSSQVSAYSSSSIRLSDNTIMNIGVNGSIFTLNNHYTIEPRVGVLHRMHKNHSIGLAYGLHSRLEKLNYYFNNSLATGEQEVNKNLDFMKSHHIVLSYDWNVSDIIHLKIEPYFQYLFSVPVIADSSFSFINLRNELFFAEKLENTGNGQNFGVDITFEKYLSKGYYFLLTTSLFDSKYKGGNGIWYNTLFNRNIVANFLIGKEWQTGKSDQNLFSINTRISYQGGNRYSPINEPASVLAKEVVFDETSAFSVQADATLNVHLTISYKLNKTKRSSEFALKIINLTQQADFYGFKYNYIDKRVDKDLAKSLIPNLSYKIEF